MWQKPVFHRDFKQKQDQTLCDRQIEGISGADQQYVYSEAYYFLKSLKRPRAIRLYHSKAMEDAVGMMGGEIGEDYTETNYGYPD